MCADNPLNAYLIAHAKRRSERRRVSSLIVQVAHDIAAGGPIAKSMRDRYTRVKRK